MRRGGNEYYEMEIRISIIEDDIPGYDPRDDDNRAIKTWLDKKRSMLARRICAHSGEVHKTGGVVEQTGLENEFDADDVARQLFLYGIGVNSARQYARLQVDIVKQRRWLKLDD